MEYLSPDEIQRIASVLSNVLQRKFERYGNAGGAKGIYSVVGRADDSLEDGYRRAVPGDNFRDYHTRLNARQPRSDRPYVRTRPNNYQKRGMVVLDVTGQIQPGSPRVVLERENLIFWLAEIWIQVCFNLGNQTGLLIPDGGEILSILPGRPEGFLLGHLKSIRGKIATRPLMQTPKRAKKHLRSTNPMSELTLEDSLEIAQAMSNKLEYVIVISDFMSSSAWQDHLASLSCRTEISVFQITDPSDYYLEDWGRIKVEQAGEKAILKSHKAKVRADYTVEAQKRQLKLEALMEDIQASHYCLSTEHQLEPQLLNLLQPMAA